MIGRRRLRALQRAPRRRTTCCSRARRARCSTSTTAPIRSSPRATAWPAMRRPARASARTCCTTSSASPRPTRTRVGGGPFPTELPIDEPGTIGHHLSTVGQERGTVTGRGAPLRLARRGAAQALDASSTASRACASPSSTCSTASTEIKICVGYELRRPSASTSCRSTPTRSPPACRSTRRLPGWSESTVRRHASGTPCRSNARRYLERVEGFIGAPIDMVSTGPDREHTILLRHPLPQR